MIIIVETSSDFCSAALVDSKGSLITECFSEKTNSHAEELPVMVRDLIQQSKNSHQPIQAVAVSKGPGSYTGLRIGTSLAKGICFSLNIPLLAVDALLGMAQQLSGVKYIVSHLDARRNEIYYALYDASDYSVESSGNLVLESGSFQQWKGLGFCGNANQKIRTICNFHHEAMYTDMYPKASFMALQAAEKYEAGNFENLDDFEPFYGKEFIAGTSVKFTL